MPELPEVEVTRQGIAPYLVKQEISELVVRQRCLRWPVPIGLEPLVAGQKILHVGRRAKYLLIQLETGKLLLHLGMSGSLRILKKSKAPGVHDHFDLHLSNQVTLRFCDPRRFGSLLWHDNQTKEHPLLKHLGPEPLTEAFDADLLYQRSRWKKVSIKNFLMDQKIVVGVGNIYANEALFLAGIDPRRQAGRIAYKRYQRLVVAVKSVLNQALAKGGTTLKDFAREDGKPGYFANELKVYGALGKPCYQCHHAIRQTTLGGRSTYFCPACQK